MAIQAHMDTAHTDLNIMKAEYIQKNCWAALGAFVVDFIRQKYVDNGLTQNLVGRSMKRAILVFIALTLTGCGIAYQPTSVRDDASANIRVVHLTPETVLEANSSPYTPQSWPNAFVSVDDLENSQNGDKRQDPIFDAQRLSGIIEWRMPQPEPLAYTIGERHEYSR